MMAVQVVGCAIVAILVGLTNADEDRVSHYLPIGIETKNCGSKFVIEAGKEYIIEGTDDFAGKTCSYSFKGQVKKNCLGLCYDLQEESFIRNNKTTISLESENNEQVFSHQNFTIGPRCSEDLNISFTLAVPDDYEFDRNNTGYKFSLAVYNKCGEEKSMTFEEAIKHLEGYHHGEEFDNKEYMTTIYGIIVGVCLAVMFLIIFGITVFYYRHHSDRKKSRSASMGVPEAFKGKTTVKPRST